MNKYSYKNLSDEAKAQIESIEVVPPSLYSTIFMNLAKSHNVDLDDEESRSSHSLDTNYSYGGLEFTINDSFSDLIEKADFNMYSDKEKIKERIQSK